MGKSVSFESLHKQMLPWANRLVSHRSFRIDNPNPCLSREDLMQEALIALWQMWTKNRRKLPMNQLGRLGTRAMQCRLISVIKKQLSKGRNTAKFVSLDSSASPRDFHLLDRLEILGNGQNELDLRLEFVDLVERVDEDAVHAALTVDPNARRMGQLKYPESVRSAIRKYLAHRSDSRYTMAGVEGGQTTSAMKKETDMDKHTNTPDNPLDDLDGGTATAVEEAVPAKAPKVRKAKSETSVKAAPKAKVSKSEKTSSKTDKATAKASKTDKAISKASKPATVSVKDKVSTRGGAAKITGAPLARGDQAKYLGGGRSSFLRKGDLVMITRVYPNKNDGFRYGLRKGSGETARMTITAGRYLEAVSKK